MRVDRAELITTQPLPEPGSGTRMQEGGRAMQAIMGAGSRVQVAGSRLRDQTLWPRGRKESRVWQEELPRAGSFLSLGEWPFCSLKQQGGGGSC